MPKSRELTEGERAQIVLLSSQNKSVSNIAKTMKCSRGAVRYTVQRYKDSGSYQNKPRSGRKRVTTARDDRILERMVLRNRTKSSKELSSELLESNRVSVSARTVRRRLVSAGLRARKARRKPLLTQTHKEKRLSWAKKYAHWTVDDWCQILWSDESNIEVRLKCLS